VDLGTADDPGGNTVNAHGQGELIHNSGAAGVSAVGNSFEADGAALTSPYRIKDKIFDALNAGGGGLVTFVPGNAYISVNGGDIQRGLDAIAAGGTVNVEAAGLYHQYDAGSKLVTVRFDGGPTLSQQPNPQDASLRDLVVTGNDGNDHIHFTPGGQEIQAQVDGFPNGRFNPTGRLVAYGVAGNNTIQVAGGITLPAWLYAGPGNDLLQGGGGNNVLVGGAGNDTLMGGRGQNLLIGGSGAATLNAGSGDDLLIAGTTAFDNNEVALAAIMAEWASGRDYATRIANLSGTGTGPRNNGDYFLIAGGPNATVFDNGAVDVLSGGSGMDWFFANVAQDIIHGRRDSEIVVGL
jgi:Ca2+-binding RTX toxin-like protein